MDTTIKGFIGITITSFLNSKGFAYKEKKGGFAGLRVSFQQALHRIHKRLVIPGRKRESAVNLAGLLGIPRWKSHYPMKKKGSFFPKDKESHTPKSKKDP